MKTKSIINVLGKEYAVQFNPITKERYFAGIPAENLGEILTENLKPYFNQ